MNEIFNSVLKMSVEGSYLIGAVILVRFILRKSSGVFSKLLWLFVGLRLVVPFSFESVFSLIPQKDSNVLNRVVSGSGANEMAVESVKTTFEFKDVLPFVWIGVAVFFALFGLISFIKLKIKISDAVLLKDRVYQSEKIDSPFVCGIVKPKIYIPYKMNDDVLECVLKHEHTHIKCFDHILKLIGFAILCVHWFNPLVWLSYVLFCKDIELFCDELVVKGMSEENRKKYAFALCDIGVEKVKFSACPIAFGEVGIKERIKNVINYQKTGMAIVLASVAVCVAVTVCFMTTPVKAQAEKEQIKPEIEKTTEPIETTIPVIETTEPMTTEETTQEMTEVSTDVHLYENEDEYENETEDTDNTYEASSVADTEVVLEDAMQKLETQQDLYAINQQRELEEWNEKHGNNTGTQIGSSYSPTSPEIFDWDPADDQTPDIYANTPSPYRDFNSPGTVQMW